MEDDEKKTSDEEVMKTKKKVFTPPVIEVIDLQERNSLYAWSDSNRTNTT